jgi:glycosyltransferase involved in cell wall biosynthesis
MIESKNETLWITWERQIRNRSMARELDLPLFEVVSNDKRFIRYAKCIAQTLKILQREKPRVVVCQNPSLVLASLLLALRPVYGFNVGIDAHFGGIDAKLKGKFSQGLVDWCNRTADFVIVTNENHAMHVHKLGGKAFICPDPFPDLSKYREAVSEVQKKVFLICSYDKDEPFLEVFEAAKELSQEGFKLFISGNYKKAGVKPEDFSHVELLGYVPEDDFYRHLFSSQIVIDLTDNDDCLVCGAYEALEAGKPLVLSKKKALQEYFTGGTVFTENRADEIAAAVRLAYAGRVELSKQSTHWMSEARKNMEEIIGNLKIMLDSCRGKMKGPTNSDPQRNF